MNEPEHISRCRYQVEETKDGRLTLHLKGQISVSNSAHMMKILENALTPQPGGSVAVDLSEVTHLDDYGVLVLAEIKLRVLKEKADFRLQNISDKINKTLSMYDFDTLGKADRIAGSPKRSSLFTRLGEATIRQASEVKYMVSFLGSVCFALLHVCLHPRSLRRDDMYTCMQKTGVDALPIVGLISFLMGLIMAFMSSVQLQQFGANIYVASLVSLAMTRELGPIMTAIIVAGRSGSAFAAEIGTMKISEEVDALFTMGFDPTRFLVTPKIIASVIVVPLLTIFSDLFAIMGGLVVGVFTLDLTANAYITQTLKTLDLFDVLLGFFKSAVFALLISWIGCLRGFRVRGGAASVGEATTSAVVSGIFLIVFFNSIFSVILRYWE
jgi:phospholipid/cholesterol/gamma-HCH transport system permease protein